MPKRPEAPADSGDSPSERMGTYRIRDLEQVRVIADPLRSRILEALCVEPRTTKQVADILGEKPTKLYHHVDALERVGLIGLEHTRQNRGTLEKYYLAVARRFEVDASLFAPDADENDHPFSEVIDSLFGRAADELRTLARQPGDLDEKALLTFVTLKGSAADVERIRQRVADLLEEIQALDQPGPPAEDSEDAYESTYRLLLAYYAPVSED